MLPRVHCAVDVREQTGFGDGDRGGRPGNGVKRRSRTQVGSAGLARRARGLDSVFYLVPLGLLLAPRILVRRLPDHRQDVDTRQPPHDFQQRALSDRPAADVPDRGGGDADRHRAGVSDRLLHRETGNRAPRAAADAGGLSALELVSGPRLRLEDDPRAPTAFSIRFCWRRGSSANRFRRSSIPRPGCTSPSARSGCRS